MGIFNTIRSKWKHKIRNETTSFNVNDPSAAVFFDSLGIDTNGISHNELNEITYFTCMKHLSETMSKMPWGKQIHTKEKGKEKEFDSDLDFLLNVRANPLYSSSIFWASMELNKNHYGNAYAYIEFNGVGKPVALWVLPSDQIEVWRDNKGIWGDKNSLWYVWSNPVDGVRYKFMQSEIIHLRTFITFDGIMGMSVKNILSNQIQSKLSADGFLKKLYDNNMFGSKVILNYTADLNSDNEKKVTDRIETYSKNSTSGKFIPLPPGFEVKMLDMKLSDAQFFENNKINALQIAAAFGIKPNVINNYDKSSYSNSETQQLDFYVNTLQPNFNAYEQELTYKLLPSFDTKKGTRLKINEKVLFAMDNATQAEVYGKYINNFIMTPNEVRENLGLANLENGDSLIGNGNYIKIDQVGTQWSNDNEGGE